MDKKNIKKTNISNEDYIRIIRLLCAVNYSFNRYTYTSEVYSICDEYVKYKPEDGNVDKDNMALFLATYKKVNIEDVNIKFNYALNVASIDYKNQEASKLKIKKTNIK